MTVFYLARYKWCSLYKKINNLDKYWNLKTEKPILQTYCKSFPSNSQIVLETMNYKAF